MNILNNRNHEYVLNNIHTTYEYFTKYNTELFLLDNINHIGYLGTLGGR